jgi:hypothetical protein
VLECRNILAGLVMRGVPSVSAVNSGMSHHLRRNE